MSRVVEVGMDAGTRAPTRASVGGNSMIALFTEVPGDPGLGHQERP
jgi:hypothetical protein